MAVTDSLYWLLQTAPMPFGLVTAAIVYYLISTLSHFLTLSPSRIPGPWYCRLTPLWTWYHSYIGDECRLTTALHKIYGPVLCIAPNEVIIADGAALSPIYSEKGGFAKAECYANFDIEGHATIFSTRDGEYRARRSKAVVGMFSMNSIRARQEVIEECVKRFLTRVREEVAASRGKGKGVNMLNLTRSLALDAVSSYLFDLPYGGLEEGSERLSASTYVDTLVAVGRFFYLPHWLFLILETTRSKFFPSKDETSSASAVTRFVKDAIHKSRSSHAATKEKQDEATYQSRLFAANLSTSEVEVQMKDLIFAGTDSTGTNLATICWWLARKPEIYARLREEVSAAPKDANPQSLRYLDAVVREGLRISMANPARLPRVVPEGGWTFRSSEGKEYHFPAGTVVGCQPYTLHFNPLVFPDPVDFQPERWLDASLDMQRDSIPFGLGTRQCIARNLASVELLLAVRAIAEEGLLEGAKAVGEGIELLEWFNSKVKGERIELLWD